MKAPRCPRWWPSWLPVAYEDNEGMSKKGPQLGRVSLASPGGRRLVDMIASGEVMMYPPLPIFARPRPPRKRATRPWAVQKLIAILEAQPRQMREEDRRRAANAERVTFTSAEWREALKAMSADRKRRRGRPRKIPAENKARRICSV